MGGGLRLFAKSTPLIIALATVAWAGMGNYWRLMSKSLGNLRPEADDTLNTTTHQMDAFEYVPSTQDEISVNDNSGRRQQQRRKVSGS